MLPDPRDFRRAPWPLLGLLLAPGCAQSKAQPANETSVEQQDPPIAVTTAGASARPKPEAAPEQASEPDDDGPRVYAKTRHVWIRPWPDASQQWIGFLWTGGSVKLKHERPVYGPGCNIWHEIEPRGFVCVDGVRATLDKNDEVLKRIENYVPKLDSPWPHHYGESTGLKRYASLPSKQLQKLREGDLERHLSRIEAARSGNVDQTLEGIDLTPAKGNPFDLGELPSSIHEPRNRLVAPSTVAYSEQVLKDDRSWLLTADLMWVPKDRVIPYPRVDFEGVHLGKQARLPLAFFRDSGRPQYRQTQSGALEPNGKSFQRLSHVELTGKELEYGEDRYLQTEQESIYVKAEDAVIPKPRKRTPWGAPVGGTDETGHAPQGRATWIEASILGGWLVAFEGTRPVFTTLISAGRGGLPVPGKDLVSTASTPVGSFPITGKFATATMEAPGELIHSDVPWTQNFHGPHALHGAYWHNDWGKLKSGGCVNVSPKDGRFLFEFTEPKLPEGWHGVRWEPNRGPATMLIVHR